MISEISKIYIKIVLTCTFGQDLSDELIDYYVKGKKEQRTVSFVLRDGF